MFPPRRLPYLQLLLSACWISGCAFATPTSAAEGVTQPRLVPTPRAQLLPASATNRPFLGAAYAVQPVDLAARGYEESELLVSGFANLYDWDAGRGVTVRVPAVPYATRILVRRPKDAARFSGRVIVELLDPGADYDLAPLWGFSSDYFLRRGDVWVGVTIKPVAARTLQRFDSVRYEKLNFPPAQSADCQAAAAGGTDSGLAWDLIAQVGALLRSSSKENPLLLLNPQRVLAAGYSEAGGYITTYANALHARLRLGDGSPVYDGYLNAAGTTPAPINQCAAPLPAADPRLGALPRDVPFVTVMTESDVPRAVAMRRHDSDEPGDVFRLYEIAGAAHSGPYPAGRPATADLTIAGAEVPAEDLCREPRGDFPAGYAFNAIWQQYDELLLQKQPMVHESLIETGTNGEVLRDALGNAHGGWRLPQIDIPLAAWRGSSTPRNDDPGSRSACALVGAKQPLSPAALKARYRTGTEYQRRFATTVDQAVKARLLTPEDAASLKQAPGGVPAF